MPEITSRTSPTSRAGATALLWLLLASAPAAAQSAPDEVTLLLPEVLASVDAHHPLIAAERANVAESGARLLEARGGFDPVVRADGESALLGFYDYRRATARVEQPTPWWGATLYGGYRINRGLLPVYSGQHETLDGGEAFAGARVPLLRDRAIDKRRADILKAAQGVEAARADLFAAQLSLLQDAAEAYFAWVAAGLALEVQAELLALADRRDVQIRQRVEAGDLPEIDALENQRALLTRRTGLIAAERELERAAIALSLFLRTQVGAPVRPEPAMLPDELTVPTLVGQPGSPSEIEQALKRRPIVDWYKARLERQRIELALAANQLLPRLDLRAEAGKDFGEGPEIVETRLESPTFRVGFEFELAVLLRQARGNRDAALAALTALENEYEFARNEVVVQVHDAASALTAASRKAEVAREAWRAAEAVAEGERKRFELGATDLLIVNLREQAAADAQRAAFEAAAEANLAAATYRVAVGTRPL